MTRPVVRLLLADPYPSILRGVRSLVEGRDFCRIAGETNNGREALQLASELTPEIAVVAYSLPDLNGIELAHAMRQRCPRLEVLLYTMHDRDEIVTEAIRAGIHGLVLKSDPECELLAALDALSVRRPYFSSSVPRELVDRLLATRPPAILTHREREVIQLIAEGRTTKEAAYILGVSTKTVETHRCRAMHKLELRTIADLVRYAARNKLILT